MTYLVYPSVIAGTKGYLPGLVAEVSKTPMFNNEVQKHASGGEVRIGYEAYPLWQWEIAYNVLRDGFRNGRAYDELRQLVGLFLACFGDLYGFQFQDPDDHFVMRQQIGVTDGITQSFTLARSYGANDSAYNGYVGSEPIGFLDTLTVPFTLYVDGITTGQVKLPTDATYGYGLSTGNPGAQLIVFNAAPPAGHTLYVDMSYMFYVRFADGAQQFDKFAQQLWALKKVQLQSLRFGAFGSPYIPTITPIAGRSLTVTSSPFTVLSSDGYVGISNNSGGALVIDLPATPATNQVVYLADEFPVTGVGAGAGTYNWTIKAGSTTVDTIVVTGGFTTLRWNGSAWVEIEV